MTVRVLIVDDHAGFREQARLLLPQHWEVVAEAADGRSALAQVAATEPDLVLLDVQLPDMNGFDLAAQVLRQRPATEIVMTSAREAGYFRRRLAQLPLPFVQKDDLSPAVLHAAAAP